MQFFSEEQLLKIKNRRRYFWNQKSDTSKDELDLLGLDVEAFSGSQEDVEDAASHCPLQTGTAVQIIVENKLEKSLQLQQMGVFQALIMESMQSLRDEMKSVKKTLPKQKWIRSPFQIRRLIQVKPNDLASYLNTQLSIQTLDEPMETGICGPDLPPQLGETVQFELGSDPNRFDQNSKQHKHVRSAKAKKHSDKRKHKVRAKYVSSSSFTEKSEASVQVRTFSKPKRASSDQEKQQTDPDPIFDKEVVMSDLPLQYAEDIETFKETLNLSDPRDTMPRSSTTILGLDDEKGQQELSPRAPSGMLPLSPYLKNAFEKFDQDF